MTEEEKMPKDNETAEVKSDFDNIWLRLVNMVIIAVLMSMASSLLGILTVAQFLIMLFNKREPNEQLAEIGTTMGVWMAKAARYQAAASEVKPWPWTELD
jgi:succinate-acetate transporter protein